LTQQLKDIKGSLQIYEEESLKNASKSDEGDSDARIGSFLSDRDASQDGIQVY
jgi:hypothetical protein